MDLSQKKEYVSRLAMLFSGPKVELREHLDQKRQERHSSEDNGKGKQPVKYPQSTREDIAPGEASRSPKTLRVSSSLHSIVNRFLPLLVLSNKLVNTLKSSYSVPVSIAISFLTVKRTLLSGCTYLSSRFIGS